MAKETVPYTQHYAAVMDALTTRGLLLGTYDSKGEPNVMTIGWGLLGSVWSRPVWLVLVRHSRFTHENLERTGCFSVNVPPPDMAEVCEVCGTRSGRDTDKFAQCHITPQRGVAVQAPTVAECPVVYECRVIHTNEVLAPNLADEIREGSYRGGDYHRCYWGEILAARAEADAAGRLR